MYKEMIHQIFITENSWTGLVLRLTLGVVLFPHAAQKMFGWFNGPGISGELQYMTQMVGLPTVIAYLAIVTECLGTMMLLTGMATRIAAVGIFGLFIGIIVTVHSKNGFFMNWFGKMPSGQEGFEYHLLVLGLCMAILIEGGGRFSIDRLIAAN